MSDGGSAGTGGSNTSDGGSGGAGGSPASGGGYNVADASRDGSEDGSSSGGAAGNGGVPISDGGLRPDACAHERIFDAGPADASPPVHPYSLDVSVTSGSSPAIFGITCPLADGGTWMDPNFYNLPQQCVSSCPGAACGYCFDAPANGLPVGPGCTAILSVDGRPGVGPPRNGAQFSVTGDPQPAVDCQAPTITGAVTCQLTWPPACVTPHAECGGQCVDLTNDANHCGACNRACTNGDSCVDSQCVCVSHAYCNGDCSCTNLSSDNANCGACGHPCDGKCTTGRCVKTLNAPYSTTDALRLVLDETSIYWTMQVSKMPIAGGTVTQLATGDGDAQGIALSSDAVFFTEYSHGLVRKVPKAGGAVVTLASNQAHPRGIAVDANNVYWAAEGTSAGTGSVFSVPIAGGTPVQLASGGAFTSDVAVDATDVYFIDQNSVMRKPLAGGNAVVFAAAENGWALRLDANNVYWASYGGGVTQQSKSGGSPIPITSVESGSIYALAVDAQFVYWALYPTGAGIRKAPIGGGPVTTVLEVSTPSIAVDATSLYFTNYFDGTVSRVTPK